MIWLYVAAAIAFAAVSGYATIQHSEKLTAQAQVAERDAKIEAQNQAILTTKAEGDRRVAAASAGAARAAQATKAYRTEAERLRGIQALPTPAGDCPAGVAVAEVRKGLKP